MSGIPFDRIAAAALSQAESLLFRWFPAGVIEGHEFKVGSIHGEPGESLSVNMRTGAWADFAGDIRGGDLTALFAAKFHGGKQGPAAMELAKDLGVSVNGHGHGGFINGHKLNGHASGEAKSKPNGKSGPGRKKDEWQSIIPPPEGVKHPLEGAFKGASRYWTYTDLDGNPTHYVLRFEKPDGGKEFRPITYGVFNGATGWHRKHPDRPLPLYGLSRLKALPDALVVLVEGEKSADKAQELFPEYPCLSWCRGAENAHHADVTPLQDRRVILWPDADEAGHKAVGKMLPKLQVEFVVDTTGLPPKFDAADLEVNNPAEWLQARLRKPAEWVNTNPDVAPEALEGSARDATKALMDEFNAKHMVVNESGRFVIYSPVQDEHLGRRIYHRSTVGDFKNFYCNREVRTGTTEDGYPSYSKVAPYWLNHRDRLQYLNGITFDPSGKQRDGVLNLWKGFAVESRQGDWSRMKEHMLTNICNGNVDYFERLMDWCAALVQRPAEQGHICVVMKGGEGTGKGILARALKHLLGQHAMAVKNAKHLVGAFNGHLRDCVFLFADEAFFAGDRAHVGVLKGIITEDTIEIEAKYQNAIEVPNYLHIMMASNETWVVPASLDSRRFFVLLVSDARKGDFAYFQAIQDQLEDGGYKAMLHELLHRDISKANLRQAPVTEGLREQRNLSLKTEVAWWRSCLERGYVWKSKVGLEKYFSNWHDFASRDLLYDSYIEFAKQARERDPMNLVALCKFMKEEMKCRVERPTDGVVGEHITDVNSIHGGTVRKAVLLRKHRARGYIVGDLDTARAGFNEITGLKIEWEDDVE